MLAEIDTEFAATREFVARDRLDPRVTAAMAAVPRHLFVPPDLRDQAYRNRPLPIGQGQTISQPFIVALMSDLAAPLPGDRVLEVGTGCGYQTAGYSDVRLRQGDGSLGWPEAAPFQAILVAAAAFKRAPPALIAQLAPGGRLVIPVAVADLPRALRFARDLPPVTSSQELRLITKDAEGRLDDRLMLPVAFVPLVEDESG
jgi:protein-L-isoaspartate(D-aspartate) O-methyltransferase